MNKIEKLHLDVIKYEEVSFTDLDGIPFTGVENSDYADIVNKSAEITKDIAIKFAEFMFSHCKEYQRGGTYVVTKPLDESKTYTTNELFEEFLKTIE